MRTGGMIAHHALPADPAAGCEFVFGEVRHSRSGSRPHAFRYRSFFMRIPATMLDGQARGNALFGIERRALISMHSRDHGHGESGVGWLRELLESERIAIDGPIWLHAFPRVFGYAFKPVSFWFCHRADGTLAAVVAEVNNTFGERHCYLLASPRGAALASGAPLHARKAFHVSPFCSVQGEYRFRFINSARRIIARVDLEQDARLLLKTSISGEPQPADNRHCLRALLAYPAFTLGVIARIHWQALRLWLSGLPLKPRPPAPERHVTKGNP